jgi:hypothetical protein
MTTQYMQKLEIAIEKYPKRSTPMTTAETTAIEEQFDIELPVAYKEYLTLTGKYSSMIKLVSWSEHLPEDQKRAKQLLKDYQLEKLIKKDFWVVADFDDAFFYIHLDEGDNPPVYRLDCENYGDMRDEYTFGKIAETFEEWINKKIDNWEHEQQYL